jgi:hypothetical protein
MHIEQYLYINCHLMFTPRKHYWHKDTESQSMTNLWHPSSDKYYNKYVSFFISFGCEIFPSDIWLSYYGKPLSIVSEN